ncbi:hypothetical protein PFDG_05532 [Plasmodium falciparum Dd2]|uniref:Uncharacterized protein n=1 Tax=Plasmodium falciparum (isolate Dd2) TaxID=57267 RepID=A0A0L7M3W0_PLAF4|nr:hypothetical protein PFDG_05532 [Plasmodium falciparum Dd2]
MTFVIIHFNIYFIRFIFIYNTKYIIHIISFYIYICFLHLYNHCDRLYKNINYKKIVLLPQHFILLGELSHENITNHKHKNNELREYKKKELKKNTRRINILPMTKRKQKSPDVTKKENTGKKIFLNMKYKNMIKKEK